MGGRSVKVSGLIKYSLEEIRKRKIMYCVIVVVCVIAVIAVFTLLKKPGIALTGSCVDAYGNITIPDNAQPLESGTLDNCVWKVYEDTNGYILDFTSTSADGVIPDYSSINDTPWNGYVSNIYGIKIENGINRVGNHAFDGATNLESIDFSNAGTLTSIGEYAFRSCSSISVIDFSGCTNLTDIESYAFTKLDSLSKVTVGDNNSIKHIGEFAFSASVLPNKSLLKSFPFEKLTHLETIGDKAFYQAGLVSINLTNCTSLKTLNGFCGCSNLRQVVINQDIPVTTIEKVAFSNTKILDFPFSRLPKLEKINDQAFEGCNNITSVDLTNCTELTYLSGFNICQYLTDVRLPDDCKIKTIGGNAFLADSRLSKFPFEKLAELEKIGNNSFQGTQLVKADLSNSPNLTELGGFKSCKQLEEVKLADNCALKTIVSQAFMDCTNLKSFDFNYLPNLELINDNAFKECSSLKKFDFTNCPKLKSIGKSCFNNCSSIEIADLSNCSDMTTISSGSFNNCTSLSIFRFPKGNKYKGTTDARILLNCPALKLVDMTGCAGVTRIRDTFSNMPSLETVIFDGADAFTGRYVDGMFKNDYNYPKDGIVNIDLPLASTDLGSQVFYNCNVSTINYNLPPEKSTYVWNSTAFENASPDGAIINIGENSTKIPTNIFGQGLKVKEVNFLCRGIISIGDNAFTSAGEPFAALCKIGQNQSKEFFVDDYGALYSKDKKTLYYIPANIKEYTVPETTEVIGPYACNMATDLESLTFADISKITALSDNAFANCETLHEIKSGEKIAATVSDARKLFSAASIGTKAFFRTGLTTGSSEEILGTMTSNRLTDETKTESGNKEYGAAVYFDGDNKLIDDNSGEGRVSNIDSSNSNTFYYLTAEMGNINVLMESPGATESKYVRVYLDLSTVDFDINNGMKVGDSISIINSNGSENIVALKKADDERNIYYLEMTINPATTGTFNIPIYIKNFVSNHETVKMWIEIVDDSSAALKTTLSSSDYYQQAEWYTAARRYGIKKENESLSPQLVNEIEDGNNVIRFKDDIQYSLKTTVADTLSNINQGQDPVKYMDFVDVLTLPEGICWETDILNAVKNNKWFKNDNKVYVTLESGEEIRLLTINSDSVFQQFNLKLDETEKNIIAAWRNVNTNLRNTVNCEITPPKVTISYNAGRVFRFKEGYETGSKIYINNKITQSVIYTYAKKNDTAKYSDESLFTQSSEAKTPVNTGSPTITLKKSYKNLGSNGEDSNEIYGGERINFYLDVQNIGTASGNASGIRDKLPNVFMISPDDMERMFSEYGKDFSVKITDVSLDTSSNVQGRTEVKTMSGNTSTIGPMEKGNAGNAVAKQQKSLYISLNDSNDILVQVCTYASQNDLTPNTVTKTYQIGNSADCDYKTLQDCFDSIGYIIKYFLTGDQTAFTCIWNNENPLMLNAGESKKITIYAHAKNTFERLKSDYDFHIDRQENTLPVNNYAYLEAGNTVAAETDLIQWKKDYQISKDYYNETSQNYNQITGNNEILKYNLRVNHYGSGVSNTLPLHDNMTGRQALLVPVKGNESAVNTNSNKLLSAMGLEIITDSDNEQYYLLNKNGNYKNIKVGTDVQGNLLCTDSISVTVETNSTTTNIYWYYDEISGTKDCSVSYKVLVRDDISLQKGTSISVSNSIYLNTRKNDRLKHTISGGGVFWDINKQIIIANPAQANEVRSIDNNTDIAMGESVTYKLKVSAVGNSENKVSYTTMYDILPQTYGLFEWTKENVHMDGFSNASEENDTWKNWRISDTDPDGNSKMGQQYIYWNNSDDDSQKTGQVVLTAPENMYIYVTLDFPKDFKIWEEYLEKLNESSEKKLYNRFHVFDKEVTVQHSIKDIGKAYLQKGVYGNYTYLNNSDVQNYNNKRNYFNNSYKSNYVAYYTAIYNSGNAKLYLEDIKDDLPDGFEFIRCYGTTEKYTSVDKIVKVNHPVFNSGQNRTTNTYPYDSAKPDNKKAEYLIAQVKDENNAGVKYMSATITPEITDDGVIFKVSNSSANNDISYDEKVGKCYLERGEALVFGYMVNTGDRENTADTAKNSIAMQYYDYNGTGLIKAPGVTVTVNEDKCADNDGTCDVVNNVDAGIAGFVGDYQTDWLMSDVTVHRGEISPGIEKHVTEAEKITGEVVPVDGGVVSATDKVKWQMTFMNNGTDNISNYTVTDVMQTPCYFVDDVTYTLYDSKTENKLYNSLTLLKDITFTDADGNQITGALKDYPKGDINISFVSDIGVIYGSQTNYKNVKLGEERECQAKFSGQNLPIKFYAVFELDENGNLELTVRFTDKRVDITPFSYSVMSINTKLPSGLTLYSSFVNNALLKVSQEFDPNAISKGATIKDDNGNAIGVKVSDIINVASFMSTSSWKTIADCNNPENKADSRNSDNYIILTDKSNNFDYTLNIVKQFDEASIDKLIIIDNLPEKNDFLTYSPSSQRNSEFKVGLANLTDSTFKIKVEDNQISMGQSDELSYTLELSTKTTFDSKDWSGTNDGSANWIAYSDAVDAIANNELKIEDIRSFRIIISGGSGIEGSDTVSVSFRAKTYGEVPNGKIAWNNFGYRYEAEGAALSASSMPVGVMTAKIPKIQKTLITDTGKAAPEEIMNTANAAFIVYNHDRIDCLNEQDLLEKLNNENIDFTVVTFNSRQIMDHEMIEFSNFKKYEINQDNGKFEYQETTENWKWEIGAKYTFTEVDIPMETQFYSLQDSSINGYTITYDPDKVYNITCQNVYHDYTVTVNKIDENDSKIVLNGAVIGQYGVFTGDPESVEFKTQLEAVWRKYFNNYFEDVRMLKEKQKTDYTLVVPSIDQLEQIDENSAFSDYEKIPRTVTEMDALSEVGSDFSQIYRLKNADGTETVYYYTGCETTDKNGRASFVGLHEDNYAYLEMVSPKGYKLDLRLHAVNRTVDYGKVQYLNIKDAKAPSIPTTGGKGITGIEYCGFAAIFMASTGIILHSFRKKRNIY